MRFRSYLTYANVMATIAVFGVMAGGSAYAISKIDTRDIANGAITAKKLHSKAVGTSKLDSGAVTNGKIAEGSVRGSSLSEEIQATVAVAGISVSADGTVQSSFNRVGGRPQVLHSGTGRYELSIPGTDVGTTGIHSATLEGEQDGEISVKR